jgi:hypothetical protein
MNAIEKFIEEKSKNMDEYSFVPHKGIQVYHTDGSFFCFFSAILEKVRYNDVVYLVVYTKNNGTHCYNLEDLESYHEFNISVPTTLNTTLQDKETTTNKKPSWITRFWNFIRKTLWQDYS